MAKADLVLEGGGLKGLGAAGAVLELMAAGYEFPRVCGTSAGAIVGCFVAAGATSDQLVSLLDRLDYRKVPDRSGLPLPLLSEGLSLLLDGGAYEGDYIHDFLRDELAELGVRTFADLRRDDPGDDRTVPEHQQWSLVVTATDITRGLLLRLPWDYAALGLDPDTQLVADAVRASMSIPLYFDPQTIHAPAAGGDLVVVDGGVLSNFPIEVFDRTDEVPPRWPTWGVRNSPDLPGSGSVLPTGRFTPRPLDILVRTLTTAVVGHDQTYLEQPGVAERTILVDTSPVGVVEFGASPAQRAQVTENGRRAGAEFLAAQRG